jgi:hypothetical protein
MASILVVGTATAADVVAQDPAVAMSSPTMHFLIQPPLAPGMDTNEVPLPTPMIEGLGQAMGADVLDGYRGGDDVDNNVIIDGHVSGNTADRIVSGSNTIQDGSFANANGINTVIQNSGSNVLIQNGMVVNVQFVDPGL